MFDGIRLALALGALLTGCAATSTADHPPEKAPTATPSVERPPSPATGEPAASATPDTDAWIPAAHRSWTQSHAVKHDLDGDGALDHAIVLTGPARDDLAPDRVLLVALSRPGGLQLVLSTSCIAMCTSCGGMMGDPYGGLVQVGERSLKVSNHGGTGWRWSADYTLAWRQDQMMVVGFDSDYFHTGSPSDIKTTSINLLSGKASVNKGPLVRHGIPAMAGDDCPAVDALAAADL